MTECADFAVQTAEAFKVVFDMGGWNAVAWVFVGYTFAGGPLGLIRWFASRRKTK